MTAPRSPPRVCASSLVAAFGDWLQAQRGKISAKSRLGEKLA
jgi:transposase